MDILVPKAPTNQSGLDELMAADTLRKGFPWLIFPSELERRYRNDRHPWLRSRVITLGWYAIAIHLAYCISDYLLLPESVHRISIAIRLLIVCPILLYSIWTSYRPWQPERFVHWYILVYTISALAIIGIILTARLQSIPIPYEGLLLMMLFGYLLTGIPFYPIIGASVLIFLAYLLAEIWSGYPIKELVYNAFFLLTANVLGAVGSYFQEHAQRTNFLNQYLIENSRDTAQHQSDSKTRLLAAASHDLRQPLHAMTLFAENLEQTLPDGEHKTAARHLKLSIEHLNQLLGSVLDISRLQVGIVEPIFKHFDLSSVIEQVVRETKRVDATEISIHRDGTAHYTAYSDVILFTRMLRNLIENGIEHACAKLILIELTHQDEGIEVSVCDDGRGIPEKELEHIFDEFHRLNRKPGTGMGLGLAIVKQMATLLAIKLSVTSVEGGGTKFSMLLPKGEQLNEEPDSEFDKPDRVRLGARILMADDSPSILSSASSIVAGWGYQVDCASSTAEALNLFKTNHYDLLISDYHFANGPNGGEFAWELRQSGYDLPIMILTADIHIKLDDPQLAPLLVAHKPLKPAKFRMMLNHLMARTEG